MARASFKRTGLVLLALLAACSADDPSHGSDAEAVTGSDRDAGDEPSDGRATSDGASTPSDAHAGDTSTAQDAGGATLDAGSSREDATTPAQDAGPSTQDAAPAAQDAATGPGTWTRGMAMPTPRTELAVAELNGKIYVAGGFGGLSAFEAYDPVADTWAQLANLPVGREHPSLAALDGVVYQTGGMSAELYAYDPAANSWSPKAPMKYARYAAAAVAFDGAIYVIGGQGESDTVIQRYDPKADAWSERTRLARRLDHVAVVALGSKIYIIGGRPGVGDVYKDVEIYDPAADRLEPGPDMQEGRSGFGAAVVDGRIYAAGGEVLVQPFSVRDTSEMLDPTTGTWALKARLPMKLHGVGAVGFRGRVYLFGGVSNPATSSPRMGGVYIFTP